MKNTMFIHCGSHKTGTTAIQLLLTQNRDNFLNKGYLYPISGIPEGFPYGQHQIAWHLDKNQASSKTEESWQQLYLEVQNNKDKNIIISSEEFFLIENIEQISKIYYLFKDWFEFKIIFYLRPQHELIQSSYITLVVFFQETRNFDEFKQDESKNKHYLPIIDAWASVFGQENMIIRPYQKEKLKNNDVVADFLDLVEFKLDFDSYIETCGNINNSYPNYIVNLFLSLNKKKEKKLKEILLGVCYEIYKNYRSSNNFFSYQEIIESINYYQEENKAIAQKYLSKNSTNLFEQKIPESKYKQTYLDSLPLEKCWHNLIIDLCEAV
jgi:hypothetical protein